MFLTIFSLLLIATGCAVVEEREALASMRPDKYWENVWVIEKKKTHLEILPDKAVLETNCFISYEGERPAEDVTVIIRSPLTYDFIEDHLAENYGTVYPGDKIEYHLHHEFPHWRERIPVGVFEEKLIDDFTINAYVGISWKYGEEEFSIQFYDWKKH